MIRSLAAIILLVLLAGCTTAEYYWQGIRGQFDLLGRAQPIASVVDETGDPVLKHKLERVVAIRNYASRELGLPDNLSYRRYAQLDRRFVLWNVFAAPELSLKPLQWCFPIAGCVNYRGYFSEAAARTEAAELVATGDDVHVGGVPAYSTLGWFDDPVLSSFVRWPETEVARLIFHELAHQLLYVKSDSIFNESFATAVEEAGLARWLAARRDPQLAKQAARADRLRAKFRNLVRTTRDKLYEIYASSLSDDDKRRGKAETIAAMAAAYETAKAGEPGLSGYDRWFAQKPNNAALAAIGIYTDRVPAFRELLHESDDDLPAFYERVRALAAKPKPLREAELDSLSLRAATAAMSAQHAPDPAAD